MLNELENRLFQAVLSAVPKDVSVKSGPRDGPADSDKELVAVAAMALLTSVPANAEEAATRRDHSYLSRRIEWKADGSVKDFPFPEDAQGELAAVETPPGHERRSGDDYFVKEGQAVVCFYRAPSEGKVLAWLRGARAEGHKAMRACRVELRLSAWAKEPGRADELCMRSLEAVLTVGPDLGSIERETESAGVRMRLLQSLIEVESIRRSRSRVADTDYYHAVATLQILGTLEITVALGEVPPEGVIDRIEYELERYGRAEVITPAGSEERIESK